MDQRTPKNPFDPLDTDESAVRRRRGWVRFVPGGMKTVVIGTAVILVALLVWEIQPSPNAGRANNPFFAGRNAPTPVGIAKAALGDIDVTLNALGTVTPLATVTVKPQVGGQLVKINFQEGQTVRAGQTLAEIDPALSGGARSGAGTACARSGATRQCPGRSEPLSNPAGAEFDCAAAGRYAGRSGAPAAGYGEVRSGQCRNGRRSIWITRA